MTTSLQKNALPSAMPMLLQWKLALILTWQSLTIITHCEFAYTKNLFVNRYIFAYDTRRDIVIAVSQFIKHNSDLKKLTLSCKNDSLIFKKNNVAKIGVKPKTW